MEQKVESLAQQKWISKLLGYDLTVEYRSGNENMIVDALSQRSEKEDQKDIQAIIMFIVNWAKKLKESYNTNLQIQQLLQLMNKGKVESLKYQLKDEIFLYKGEYTSIKNVLLRRAIFHYIHNSLTAGHSRYEKTLR